MGALVGLFQAQLEGVPVGVLVLQQQVADLLAMTFPLGFDILQSEIDAIVDMRSKKVASLPLAMAQHCVNAVSWSVKTVSGFARYAHRRPACAVPAEDGSLDVDHIWTFGWRRLGFSRLQLLQHIADHAISDSGRRRFLLRSDIDGRTWVSVAEPFRRMPRRHRHRPRRGTHQDEERGQPACDHARQAHSGTLRGRCAWRNCVGPGLYLIR